MKRVIYFDLLNVLACISVVTLHCNSYVHSFAHDAPWMRSLFSETVFYAAVPIFFMLSGATLFDFRKRDDVKTFYQKRIKKTVVPYLIFSVGFYVLYWIKGGIKNGCLTSFNFYDFFNSIFTGHIPLAHYWFFIPLFVYYLFVPFLEKMVAYANEKFLLALLGFIFSFQTLFPVFNYYFHLSLPTSPSIYGFVAYAILGYTLSKYNYERKNMILIFTGVGSIACWCWRYCAIYHSESFNSFFFSYYNFYALLPAVFFFLLCKRLNPYLQECPKFANFLKTLSSLSFGIYLLHGFVVIALPFDPSSIYGQIVKIPIAYIICALSVFFFKKVKFYAKSLMNK